MKSINLKYIETCANEREHASVQKLSCADVRQLLKERAELLEALQGCVDELELHEKHARDTGDTDLLQRLNAARAAIAKATQ